MRRGGGGGGNVGKRAWGGGRVIQKHLFLSSSLPHRCTHFRRSSILHRIQLPRNVADDAGAAVHDGRLYRKLKQGMHGLVVAGEERISGAIVQLHAVAGINAGCSVPQDSVAPGGRAELLVRALQEGGGWAREARLCAPAWCGGAFLPRAPPRQPTAAAAVRPFHTTTRPPLEPRTHPPAHTRSSPAETCRWGGRRVRPP